MRRGGCERDCGEILLHRLLLLLEKSLLVTSAPVCIPLISDSSQRGCNRGLHCLADAQGWVYFSLNLYWFYQWVVDLKRHYMPFCLFCLWKAKLCSHSLEVTSLLWCLVVAQWKNNNEKQKTFTTVCFRFQLPAWSWRFPPRKTKWVQGQPERPQGRGDSGVRLTPRPC